MSERIKLLTEEVIGKISAGEVVERPASVVKELVENSIDAEAGSITVELEDAGRKLIRVSDDGLGMSDIDLKNSIQRHATSKLKDITDLESLDTLGFRGEALASISAVSLMEVTTWDGLSESASSIITEAGRIQKSTPASRVRGTTISVKNLFYNVPARRKFLKKDSTELAVIVEIIGRFIISFPSIEIKLVHGDRVLMHAAKGMDMRERIALVLGKEMADNMVEINDEKWGYSLSGFMSNPAYTRKDKRAQVFFVNKRYVKSKILSDSLQDAYRSMLERGKYPSAVLFIKTDPSKVDVNIHPTKLLVKFESDKDIRAMVSSIIRNKFDDIKTELSQKDDFITMPKQSSRGPVLGDFKLNAEEVQEEFKYSIPARKTPEPFNRHSENISEEKYNIAGDDPLERDNILAGWNKIFQVGGCYIVQIHEDKITITDQHAAHERILYEYFSKVLGGDQISSQNLLFPIKLELSASDAIVMDKLMPNFKSLGFDVDSFGGSTYIVRAVPSILKDSDISPVMQDVLEDFSGFDFAKVDPIDELVKMTSCRAAIKAGDSMNVEEMVTLLNRLNECDLPFTCPHGRPVTTEINVDELEKRFRRK